eukprot:gene12365-13635_t
MAATSTVGDVECEEGMVDKNMSSAILSNLDKLRKDGILCDVVIKCGTNSIIAHKVVLAAASQYFCAMFSNGMSESQLYEIELKDLDYESMNVLVDYTYTGVLKIQNDNAQSVLEASDLLQFKNVKQCCSEYIKNKIDINNCLDIHELGDRYSCEILSKETSEYFNKHFVEIAKSAKKFMDLSSMKLKILIQNDEINVDNETQILNACMLWVGHDAERKKYLPELLRHLRLPFVQPSELKKILLIDSSLSHILKEDLLLVKPRSNKLHHYNDASMRNSYKQWLYILGGEKSFLTEINDVECFEHKMKTWTLCQPLKNARSSFAAVVVKGKLYIIGGMRKSKKLRSAKCYDPETRKWTTLPPPLKCMGDIKAAVVSDILYVAGGSGEREFACRYLEKYDPNEKRWERLENMIKRRRRFNLVELKGLIYALGGFDDIHGDLKSMEHYDPSTNCWTRDASMITARNDFGSVVLSGHIYAVGGANGSQGSMNLVERYNPVTNVWSQCARMNNCRGGLSVAVYFGRIVALSGMNIYMALLETAEYYNETENKWFQFPSLQIARFGSVAICLPFEMPSNVLSVINDNTE